MKRLLTSLALVISLTSIFPRVAATDDDHDKDGYLKAFLSGYGELPPVSTTGQGYFLARFKDPNTLEYKLSFSKLEGNTPTAHIYFGQPWVQGGILANLCGGVKPPCTSGQEMTGTITSADILNLAPQGIEAGNFEEALRAIRSGNTYVNVLSDAWPQGEIRGQILPHRYGLNK
jgi:hypothetical protein